MPSPSRPAAIVLDARYALRAVRSDPRLVIFAVLIIGLGVGACTAVFSVLNPLLLRSLQFEDAERLVWIANDGEGGMSSVTSRTSNLRDFRALSDSFDGLTGYNAFFEGRSSNLVGRGEPVRLVGVGVADDFLDVLGVRPLHGRNFDRAEGQWNGPRAVILSHALWVRQFGSDPTVVGTSISLDDEPADVVGVLPPTFDFASVFAPHTRVDFLRTFAISDETDRRGNTLTMIGRLAPGATVASAQADLLRIIDGLEAADPERWGLGAVVTGMQTKIAGPFRSALLLLAAAALAVMLIVCVNLSNLLLAKGGRRRQEMAVRSALGAPRGRLVRQLMIESLVLSAGGAIVGLGIALTVTHFVARADGLSLPLLREIGIDTTALVVSVAIALVTGLVVGIAPAMTMTRGGEAGTFRDARRGMSASRRATRLRAGLVIAEVALACVLLVFGGLLLQSFRNVLDVDLGYEPAGVVSWKVYTVGEFESLGQVTALYDRLVNEVESIPGVLSVGLTDAAPLGRNRTWPLSAPGREYDGEETLFAFPHMVDRRYLETMAIPLLAGRHFTAGDDEARDPVVILNETAAAAVFQGEEALGRTVRIARWDAEVIGIVKDTRHRTLEVDAGLQMYMPFTQIGDFSTLDMMVRASVPTQTLAKEVAAAIGRVDPAMPATEFRTLDSLVDLSVSPRRFTVQLLGAFAVSALLLAALGIYGVLSYTVSERIPEIGIRMALGETGVGILQRVVGHTLSLAAAGLVLGAIAAAIVSRFVASMLYGVEAADPVTFVAMATILLVVAGLAGLIPALRAARTDAAAVLRAN